ncbi:MAG: hypothetical protein AUJ51_03655 [Elusimicrobia bacterium CG1_02_56_21]|nr:MAG: hypothetical protein AUJ51_03655 [Elusimicrobia bacterium CG1_02_56_21]
MTDAGTNLYERFFNLSNAMLCTAAPDGLFSELNPAWEKELGIPSAELKGRPCADLVHPEDRAPVLACLKSAWKGGAGAAAEARFRCKNGDYKYFLLCCAADPEKGLIYIAATGITRKKLAEAAICEDDATLRRIIDLAPMSMAIVNLQGTIEYINRKAEETFGYPHSEIPNMERWWEQAYPEKNYRKEVVEKWMGHVQDAIIRKTEIDGGEYRVTCRDGRIKTVYIFGVVTAGRVFVMFDDISARAEGEKALRHRESLYRALIETTRTGYNVVDGQGKVIDANQEYVRLSGHSDLKEIIGRNVNEWTSPQEKEKNAEAVKQCVRDGHIFNFETEYTGKSGKAIPIEINATVVNREGSPQILGLCRDITERRKEREEISALNHNLEAIVAQRTAALTSVNQNLVREITQRKEAEKTGEQLREELLQSQKIEAVGRLAGGIAHDFNNILGAISGYAEFLIKSMPENGAGREDLEEILAETELGSLLTRQLTAMSRKQPVQLKVLDLNKIAVGTCRMMKRLISADIRLETVLPESTGMIKADSGQISQVIMNLVVNARDAMPDGGKILLETGCEQVGETKDWMPLPPAPGRYLTLAVTDSGHGMDKETMTCIFEPFFTTKSQGLGTGLGLATVYEIAAQARGGIYVSSRPGGGTTFKIYFPLASEKA